MVHLAKHWNTVPSQLRCEVDGTEKNRFETQFCLLPFNCLIVFQVAV